MTSRARFWVWVVAVLCVDVRIDQTAYLDCLREMFQATAHPTPTLGTQNNPAAAPAPSVGVYNQAAIREMLGGAYGHSVIPQRPQPSAPARLGR